MGIFYLTKDEAVGYTFSVVRGSSNGRTIAFEAVYHGSNPCPRVKSLDRYRFEIFSFVGTGENHRFVLLSE